MPSSRPRISLSRQGVCNGCLHFSYRQEIDYVSRLEELSAVLKQPRSAPYDAVVAWSGGKDSSAIALRLRDEFGANVLLVTVDQMIPTAAGRENRRRLIDHGFDSVLVEPNGKVSRELSWRFLTERGDPKLGWSAAVHSTPVRIARDFGIRTVFFAENGEIEYGGRAIDTDSELRRSKRELVENVLGEDPATWVRYGFGLEDLEPYRYPENDVTPSPEVLYFAYFVPWDGGSNFRLVESSVGFTQNPRGRNYGAYAGVNGVDDAMEDLYYYLQALKFGFGRAHKDASRDIQRGLISKREAVKRIAKFDAEYPSDSMEACAAYYGVALSELNEVVEKHRNYAYWEKSADNGWKKKYELREADI